MRRLLLALAAALAACQARPVIESFTVDEPNPDARATIKFSYSVRGAATIRIEPLPGPVFESPVFVVPMESGTFKLRAFNDDGVESSRNLSISVRAPFDILTADALPGQVSPGAEVRLSWATSSAERATLTDGSTGQVSDVPSSGSIVVHPTATTIYTLTAFNKAGRLPETRTARMTARVAAAPSVSNFVATPAAIGQGESSKLTWTGNALSYSVSAVRADAPPSTFFVGAQQTLVVRPDATTTYTLHAAGPSGVLSNPPAATVTVTPRPAAVLAYTPGGDQQLQLVAECGSPCTNVTLAIRGRLGGSVRLRGLAFDLPLDSNKVSFDPASFVVGPALGGAVARAAMGTGVLSDVLVVGIAMKGDSTAAAPDLTIAGDAEVARFALALKPGAGVGPVFDGSLHPTTYKAILQRATGRVANAIAVGRLDAQ